MVGEKLLKEDKNDDIKIYMHWKRSVSLFSNSLEDLQPGDQSTKSKTAAVHFFDAFSQDVNACKV